MTAPDIRAQAIDAIARVHYAAWKEGYDRFEGEMGGGNFAPGYDDSQRWAEREVAIASATQSVDALAEAGLLPTNSRWAAVHDTFTDYENLDHEVITSREQAQKELDSWGGGGRLVGYFYTDWQEAGE